MTEEQSAADPDSQRAFAQALLLGTPGKRVLIRFMAEVGCDFALWDPDNSYLGELEDRLPISAGLRAQIKDWAVRGYEHDGGERRMTVEQFDDFRDEGRLLSEQLQVELGPDFRVRYHP